MSGGPALARRLGLGDAVALGLGSMLGAGVFAVWGPASTAAGGAVLVALALAATVAVCNATSSAQLAAQYPTSGGTYVHGRERLGAWPGFLAGWAFVVGKTASCAAMALTVAAYTVPAPWQRPAAVAVVLLAGALGYRGITRTARATRVVLVVVLTCLAVALLAALTGTRSAPALGAQVQQGWTENGVYGVLQAAGLLFFAFAGYARVATLGEEVRTPARTIPRAVLLALTTAAAVYAVVAVTLLATLGADATAAAVSPLADAVAAGRVPGAVVVVGAGAAAASFGALLALLAGVSRTVLAMARGHDLPHRLGAVHPVHEVPHRAEAVVVVAVAALAATGDLRWSIGLSSTGVLVYYLVANLSAWTQTAPHRRYPRGLQALGALLCVALVASLPLTSLLAGLAVLLAGVLYRAAVLRARRRGHAAPRTPGASPPDAPPGGP